MNKVDTAPGAVKKRHLAFYIAAVKHQTVQPGGDQEWAIGSVSRARRAQASSARAAWPRWL